MRYLLVLIILLTFSSIHCSAEENIDDFSDFNDFSTDWDTQEVIPAGQFEELLKQLKNNKKKKGNEEQTLYPSTNEDEENKKNIAKYDKDTLTLLIPTIVGYDGGILPVGFYKVAGMQNSAGEFFLDFYQGLTKIASCPAFLSTQNYNKESINYVEFLPQNNDSAKIIFGSLDYNLETMVRIYKK